MRLRGVSSTAASPLQERLKLPSLDELVASRKQDIHKGYYPNFRFNKEFIALVTKAEKPDRQWDLDSFNWKQNISENLRTYLVHLDEERFFNEVLMALPYCSSYPRDKKEQIFHKGLPSKDSRERDLLIETLVKERILALKIWAQHISAMEQLAVAPLSGPVKEYRRYPAVQETAAKIIFDESKHGRTVATYLNDMLHSKIEVYQEDANEYERYLSLTKFMPGASVLLALIVETVGNAFFKHIAKKSPEPLLGDICRMITERDEQFHIDSCKTLYQMVHDSEKQTRFGKYWEELRNKVALWVIARKIYAKNLDPKNPLFPALAVLGIDSKELLGNIKTDLTNSLGSVGIKVNPAIFPKM